MPDITLLPVLAEYFEVTVDELLGLKPLPGEEYKRYLSGSKGFWDEKLDYLKRTRTSMWNKDYIKSQGWDKQDIDYEEAINKFMNYGMDRKEAETYCNKQEKVTSFLEDNKGQVAYIHIIGLLISYGIK